MSMNRGMATKTIVNLVIAVVVMVLLILAATQYIPQIMESLCSSYEMFCYEEPDDIITPINFSQLNAVSGFTPP